MVPSVDRISSERPRAAGLLLPVLLAIVAAVSGCGGGSASTSSGDAQKSARVVLQADLQPGSTGGTAARLAQRFIELEGVAGTRGDAGQHVWIYSTPDATAEEVTAMMTALRASRAVAHIERVR
jgi:hypothetical protein